MANAITILRIIFSMILIFVPTFSPVFYIFYILAGIFDMLDGFIARKTKTESHFGSKLDTVADFIFVSICLLKLIPVLSFPNYIIIWIIIIAVIKLTNAVIKKGFLGGHTKLNKLTGFLLFLYPLSLPYCSKIYTSLFVLMLCTIAAICEIFN